VQMAYCRYDVPMIRRWHFSLLLLAVYLAVFRSWMNSGPAWIIGSGVVSVAGLSIAFAVVRQRGYFINRWDQGFHAAVILDLLAEGLWIRDHSHRGFYLCALGFVLAVGGYRLVKLRARR